MIDYCHEARFLSFVAFFTGEATFVVELEMSKLESHSVEGLLLQTFEYRADDRLINMESKT